ncbi:AB hydrolase superfamily protein B1A11.02 [Fusarium oxysporum f. sp. albedinis]|nr:AB hydrolase superfamily protein B1A11.02 [Fusarium oxysporum f. sp. albedinis]
MACNHLRYWHSAGVAWPDLVCIIWRYVAVITGCKAACPQTEFFVLLKSRGKVACFRTDLFNFPTTSRRYTSIKILYPYFNN